MRVVIDTNCLISLLFLGLLFIELIVYLYFVG